MKEIKYFEKYYITTCGKVISKHTKRIMSYYIDNLGYKCVKLKKDDKTVSVRIHRLVGYTYLDLDKESDNVINHLDGNKLNCSVLNLEISTNQENTIHAYEKNMYDTRNKISLKTVNIHNNEIFICNSLRDCERKTGINRKTIKSIIEGIISNDTGFEFRIIDFDTAFRIKDELGNDFRSCLQCSQHYGFDSGRFAEKCKHSEGVFKYKNICFEKYYV